jgi:hypothetical protein
MTFMFRSLCAQARVAFIGQILAAATIAGRLRSDRFSARSAGLTSGAFRDANDAGEEAVEEAMRTLPADEDYARALMTIFAAEGARAGQSLADAALVRAFGERNYGDHSDYRAALDYAVACGWLTPAFDRIRLTPAGFEEL